MPEKPPSGSGGDISTKEDGGPGNGAVAPRRGPLAKHQLECVALLAIGGCSYDAIASQVGCTAETVKTLVRDGGNPTYNSIDAAYRDKMLQASVKHQYRLTRKFDDAYAAIDKALTGNDVRVAVENAWKLFDNALPGQARKAESPGGDRHLTALQINIQSEAHEATTAAIEKLGPMLAHLGAVVDEPDPHTRRGLAALPQAYNVPAEDDVEIVDADFSANPDE